MIYVKVHKTEKGDVIAMCDEDLLGKVLRDGKAEVDLKTYSDFYRGDLMSPKQAELGLDLASMYSANVVGKESVKVMVAKGVVGEGQVRKISKVPFVQLYTLI
ncbi:MAG: DUF424 family protein [Candidatus Micrarchaeota archaeon]|nr:DUF424 family protein [Candidatus Micrarchaeota archaeon]